MAVREGAGSAPRSEHPAVLFETNVGPGRRPGMLAVLLAVLSGLLAIIEWRYLVLCCAESALMLSGRWAMLARGVRALSLTSVCWVGGVAGQQLSPHRVPSDVGRAPHAQPRHEDHGRPQRVPRVAPLPPPGLRNPVSHPA
eukprot:878065-Rhodomonas_salina.1